MRLPTEHDEQVAFVRWLRLQHPNDWVLAVPNGGLRHKRAAARLKAEGVSPGVPDLYIPSRNLWIEMKRAKGGAVSQAQKDWRRYLELHGHAVLIGRGFDDAVRQVSERLKG